MSEQTSNQPESTPTTKDPSAEALAEIDRLHALCLASAGEIQPQIDLWTAVAALENWVIIKRGTPESPQPYVLAAESGNVLCVYSSAARAQEGAETNGLTEPGVSVPLMAVPLPDAIDWALSLGQVGITGVTIDYPRIGSWCPLPNLENLRANRA